MSKRLALADAVELFRHRITDCLMPEDIDSLLQLCGHLLTPPFRDDLATGAIRTLAIFEDVHLGDECDHDWMQAEPKDLEGAMNLMECHCYSEDFSYEIPEELPLPRLFDAKANVLEALCLVSKGVRKYCGSGLQLVDLEDNSKMRFGTFQPVVFPLVTVLEEELVPQWGYDEDEDTDDDERWDPDYDWQAGKIRKRERRREARLWSEEDVEQLEQIARDAELKPINADNKNELLLLMNLVEEGFGTRFFTSTANQAPRASGIVEEHWNGIEVDLTEDTTTCRFCASHDSELLQQHCEAVFQPLKKFMVRHLKHVHYVRPSPERLSEDVDAFHVQWYLDLIAGFTPSGVLCGVYLTDTISPDKLSYGENLAEGAVDMHLTEGPDRILRRRIHLRFNLETLRNLQEQHPNFHVVTIPSS